MILKLFVNLFTFISPVQVNKDHWLSNNYLIVLFIRIIKSMGFVHLSPTDSQQDGFQTGALGLLNINLIKVVFISCSLYINPE